MNLLAAIILYYPDRAVVIRNILQFVKYVDKLIIWDNTPENDTSFFNELNEYSNKIIYRGEKENCGISYPLNRCAEYAIDNCFTHLLTMDQDSYFIDFDAFKKNIECNVSNARIFAPLINRESDKTNLTYQVVDYVIQSGSVFDVRVFREIGFFREDFFIDQVDIEFCYRARKNGFQSIIFNCSSLNHELGHSKGGKKILGSIHITSDNYPAFRRFYLVRNTILLMRLYPEFFHSEHIIYFIRKTIFRQIAKIILSERNKLGKVYSIIKGVFTGVCCNLKN